MTGKPAGARPNREGAGISEREARIHAANMVNEILHRLGGLSALVPRGPLRDRVDDETEHIAVLAEEIGRWTPRP